MLTFGVIDYIIFSLLLAFSVAVGIYFGCFGSKQNTIAEYLFGGKKMLAVPVGISIFSSITTASSAVAFPTEVYLYGINVIMSTVASFVASLVFCFLFLPLLFDLNISSLYEYMEMRFSVSVRIISSLMFLLQAIFHSSISLFAAAISISNAMGVSIATATWTIGGACTFYTALGGIKSVVWTDSLQAFVIIASLIAILIIGTNSVGNINSVLSIANENGVTHIDLNPNPFKRLSIWSAFFGSVASNLSMNMLTASSFQRYISVSTLRESRLSNLCSTTLSSSFIGLCILVGLTVYAYYVNCDPVKTGKISNPDQILSLFAGDTIGSIPGMMGLFMSSIVSAHLSTMSSYLNTMSGTIYYDFIYKFNNKFSDAQGTVIMKITACIAGLLTTVVGLFVGELGNISMATMMMTGVTGGVILGIFILGIFTTYSNTKGIIVGSLIALSIMTWILIGAVMYSSVIREPYIHRTADKCPNNTLVELYNNTIKVSTKNESQPLMVYKLSYMLYSLTTCILVTMFGSIVSLLTKDERKVQLHLIAPFVRKFVKKHNKQNIGLEDGLLD